MTSTSDRLTLAFACLGHGSMHMLTAFFFVIVLALEVDWQRPYHELIELWTLGALFIGLFALPSGWLADRWSAPGMMTVMFLGMGAACLFCAGSDSSTALLVYLSALGIFAAIYHPVGIPWVVRNARASGKALGINGIFGGLGVASAGAFTGLLIDELGWRAAFAVPGVVCVLAGLALLYCLRTGLIRDRERSTEKAERRGRSNLLRGFLILLFTMFSLGFVYQASQAAFPKLFDLRLSDWVGEGTLGVGLIVSIVYATAAFMQLIGGYLADLYSLRRIYMMSFFLQIPMLVGVSVAFGMPLVGTATLAVLLSSTALPAENLLLVRHSPRRHQSLAFGLKFVLAFGTTPLAIGFVSRVNETTGDFTWVFLALAGIVALAFGAAAALPKEMETV
jgi:MFS family permease